MNYLSLYRKYRPKSFKDVIGQEYIVKILKNSIKNNQVANAYVFAGTKGTGKTSIAKIYANAINCLHNEDGDVCGKCEVCQDFANNQVVDIVELDAASNNGVDEVRQISEAAMFLPAKLSKKVYIIDEAHMLTTQAWNALLKLVEEPPKHVMFIFATTEMHKIPATIISRCQCFRFNKILNSDIVKLLTKVCKAENIKFDEDALKTIADIADGSARDSLSILEQTATYSNNDIKVEDIYKIYGLLSPKEMVDFVNLLTSKDTEATFKKINEYFLSGINFPSFAALLVSVLTDKLIFEKTKNPKLLTKVNETLIKEINLNDVNALIRMLDIWQETYFKVVTPTDVRVIIDHAILKSLSVFEQPTQVVVPVKSEPKKETKVIQPTLVEPAKPVDNEPWFKQVNETIPTKPVVESKPQPKPAAPAKAEPKKEVDKTVMPSQDEVLVSIFANKDKKYIDEATKVFNEIKDGTIDIKAFSHIQSAKKVLLASEDGVVLLFDDEADATILNREAVTPDFIIACCNVFRNPKFFLGYTIEQINQHKDIMQQGKKDKKPLLGVESLRAILNKDGRVEQLAYNLLYSQLDEKDRK